MHKFHSNEAFIGAHILSNAMSYTVQYIYIYDSYKAHIKELTKKVLIHANIRKNVINDRWNIGDVIEL